MTKNGQLIQDKNKNIHIYYAAIRLKYVIMKLFIDYETRKRARSCNNAQETNRVVRLLII